MRPPSTQFAVAFTLSVVGACPAPAQQSIAPSLAGVSAPLVVRTAARRGPNLGSRQLVTPDSGVETPLDIGRRAHTHYKILVQPQAANALATAPSPRVGPPFPGYLVETPASLACVYRLVSAVPGCNPDVVTEVSTGGSRMIAIVDAYHLPTAAADLQAFSTQFGLPPAKLSVVFATGTQPAVNAGWAMEEALDIEMAHAAAPNASITLVEAASSNFSDLAVAIDAAYTIVQQAGGGQVSMSFGGSEFASETAMESHFAKEGNVVFYASSGDTPGTSYPSTSPNVVAVGGTAISRESLNGQTFGNFLQETAWADAGGGLSSVFQRPAYQNALNRKYYFSSARAVPDVAAVASNLTPVWIYCSSCSSTPGWSTVAGTSVASPLMAGMANKWGAFRQSSKAELTYLYTNAFRTAALFNVSQGVCGPGAGFFTQGAETLRAGYDLCTGLGAPRSPKAF